MVKFDITNYLVAPNRITEAVTDGSDMIQWLRTNIGELDQQWLDAYKIKAEDITNTARGYGWAMSAGLYFPAAKKRTFTWIVELEDDTAAMHFKLIWPEAKILNEQV